MAKKPNTKTSKDDVAARTSRELRKLRASAKKLRDHCELGAETARLCRQEASRV